MARLPLVHALHTCPFLGAIDNLGEYGSGSLLKFERSNAEVPERNTRLTVSVGDMIMVFEYEEEIYDLQLLLNCMTNIRT